MKAKVYIKKANYIITKILNPLEYRLNLFRKFGRISDDVVDSVFLMNHVNGCVRDIKLLKRVLEVKATMHSDTKFFDNNVIGDIYSRALVVLGRIGWMLETINRITIYNAGGGCRFLEYQTNWIEKNINKLKCYNE